MAHKVKVTLPYIDWDGIRGNLSFDAEVQTDCFRTVDGIFTGHLLGGMQVDCMPDISREAQPETSSIFLDDRIKQFEAELSELQQLAEDNYQKEYTCPSSDWRQANSSGYLAAVKDIYSKFCKIFKED